MSCSCAKTKNCYFLKFFKAINIVATLLFTCLAFTALLFNYQYGLIGMVKQSPALYKYALILCAVLVVMVAIYMLLQLKKADITIADSFAFTFVVSAIVFLICGLATNKTISMKMGLACALLIIFGVAYILSRAYLFRTNKACGVKANSYKSNSVINILKAIDDKFSFLTVILFTCLFTILSFLVFYPPFRSIIIRFFNAQNLVKISLIFVVVAIVAYGAMSIFKKELKFFDVILVALIPVFFMTFMQFILFDGNGKYIKYAVLAGTAVYLLVLILRVLLIDVAGKTKTNAFFEYVASFNKKYSIFLPLAIGGIIITYVIFMLRTGLIGKCLDTSTGSLIIDFKLIPLAVLLVAFAFLIVLSIIISVLKVKDSEIGFGDFALVALIFTSIFALILLYVKFSVVLLVLSILLLVLEGVLLVKRIKAVSKK